MQKNKLLDKLFLIIVSILTIMIGIVFIVQVLRIYFGNDKVYTQDICAKYLLEMLPIIIIWFVMVVASSVYFGLKNNFKQGLAKITNASKLKNLETMCPIYNENLKDEYDLVYKEDKKRKIVMIINIFIVCLCAAMSLGYLLNVKHFDSNGDLTKQAKDMSFHLLPWVIIAFGSMISATIYEEISSKKSIDLIKYIIKNNGKKNIVKYNNQKNNLVINIARISIIGISVVLIVVGIFDGGATDVLQKAINICTECIGLG